jgi:hypothetical protein
MSSILTASYSYQTLEYVAWYAQNKGEEEVEAKVPILRVTSHMKERGLDWRQRNEIISYMKRVDWLWKDSVQVGYEYRHYYVITRTGRQELETATGLGWAVKEAAQKLQDSQISKEQAMAAAAEVVAAALRAHARSDPSENSEREEASAGEIEEAARTHDPERIDHAIARTKDLLTILNISFPFIRDILHIFGL